MTCVMAYVGMRNEIRVWSESDHLKGLISGEFVALRGELGRLVSEGSEQRSQMMRELTELRDTIRTQNSRIVNLEEMAEASFGEAFKLLDSPVQSPGGKKVEEEVAPEVAPVPNQGGNGEKKVEKVVEKDEGHVTETSPKKRPKNN